MATSSQPLRTRERDTDEETTEGCPECGGTPRPDGTERVCEDCGAVCGEDAIDHGPEWRRFEETANDEPVRCGAPLSESRHDRGLYTNISYSHDSDGRALDEATRRKFERLRVEHSRAQAGSSADRYRRNAFIEISRMAAALGLSNSLVDQACRLYRTAESDIDNFFGRSIEGIASACLYAAARVNAKPVLLKEIGTVSRVSTIRVKRAYSALNQELGLPAPPPDPVDYVGKVTSAVDCPPETRRDAEALAEAYAEAFPGRVGNPGGIAAAAVYETCRRADVEVSQEAVAEPVGVCVVTVRNRYHEMEDLEVPGDE